MDDLISRAAAIRAALRWYVNPDGGVFNAIKANIRSNLEQVPAVVAVPVVRCKDCKYGEPDTNGNGEDMVMCQYKQNPIGFEDWLMPPDWFCADGERNEG